MELSIVLVNYKSPHLLLNCIESILLFDNADLEIIVVDNFSQDNTEELLIQKYPQVRFVQMGYNSGFARANNAGIRIAKAEVVLLLNSDTIVIDDAINKTLQSFISSDYVAGGVQLLNEDGTPQISGNYVMKGALNNLLPLPFFGNFLKKIAEGINIKKTNLPEASSLVEVDWINGAFLMVKKSAIEKAGLMDEDFFLYAEEAEWCGRLKKYGKLCIYGQYKVLHLRGETANEAFASSGKGYFNLFDRKGLQIMLSNFLRIRKQFGLGWYFFHLFFYILNIPIFIIGIVFSKIFQLSKSRYNFGQWLGYTKNIISLIAFLPSIVMNKPRLYKVL
jgi:GT2 family glycosyltransferase